MTENNVPTKRELEILSVLWRLKQATVREVYEQMRSAGVPIVQNTVQAFLRTMEDKGLVTHTTRGRAFVYRPTKPRETTGRRLVGGLLNTIYGGAIDQLVDGLFSYRKPSAEELDRLDAMIDAARASRDEAAPRKSSKSQPRQTKKGES